MVQAIKRTQGPVLNLMHLYGIQDISSYCGKIDSVSEICSIYQSTSRQKRSQISNITMNKVDENENEEVMMQGLTNLALDFNNGNGNNLSDNIEPFVVSNVIIAVLEKDDSNSNEQGFNCKNFFTFCVAGHQ